MLLPHIVETDVLNVEPDNYEPDDDMESASHIYINDPSPQHHNFHRVADEDWITFHALANVTYNIKTFNLGADCNTELAIYRANGEFEDKRNRPGDMEWEWKCRDQGIYFLKIIHGDPEKFGKNTNYV